MNAKPILAMCALNSDNEEMRGRFVVVRLLQTLCTTLRMDYLMYDTVDDQCFIIRTGTQPQIKQLRYLFSHTW